MTIPQSNIDWSRYMEGLAGKMNNDMTNIPPAIDFVVESGAGADGVSWYRKYRSGWIEQWGRAPINKSTAYKLVDLPKPMQSTTYTVSLTQIRETADTGNDYSPVFSIAGSTTTQISIRGDNNTTYIDWVIRGQGA